MKVLKGVCIAVISLFLIGSGTVAGPGRFWLLLLLAVWIGRRRQLPKRWWAAALLVVLVMIVLRGVTGEIGRAHV